MPIDDAFTHFPALTTERLRLRQIRPGDTEALYAIYSDAETMRYYGEPYHIKKNKKSDLFRAGNISSFNFSLIMASCFVE